MGRLTLGVLDFCILQPGQRPSDRLAETLRLAEAVDTLGYRRYWLSEHHTTDVAHACPEMLVPLILDRTRRLHAGPAGILLRYQSPFKVAETFHCLSTLFPGRVDLGLARGAPDDQTARALLDNATDLPGNYERKVRDLVQYLSGSAPSDSPEHAGPPALPVADPPDTWVLGTSAGSAPLAAELGTGFVLGLFLKSSYETATPAALDAYRAAWATRELTVPPRAILTVAGVCTESWDEAGQILVEQRNPFIVPTVFGPPDVCLERLEHLADQYGTREIVFAALGNRFEERLAAYELLARAAGLMPCSRANTCAVAQLALSGIGAD